MERRLSASDSEKDALSPETCPSPRSPPKSTMSARSASPIPQQHASPSRTPSPADRESRPPLPLPSRASPDLDFAFAQHKQRQFVNAEAIDIHKPIPKPAHRPSFMINDILSDKHPVKERTSPSSLVYEATSSWAARTLFASANNSDLFVDRKRKLSESEDDLIIDPTDDYDEGTYFSLLLNCFEILNCDSAL